MPLILLVITVVLVLAVVLVISGGREQGQPGDQDEADQRSRSDHDESDGK